MISTVAARSIRAGIRMGRGGDIDGVGFTWPKLVGAAYVRTRVRFVAAGRVHRHRFDSRFAEPRMMRCDCGVYGPETQAILNAPIAPVRLPDGGRFS